MPSLSAPSLPDLDAGQLSAAYAAAETDPVEVVTACLQRMDELEPALHAMSDRLDQEALAAAEASKRRWESGEQLGVLDGVPLTLKENQQVAGLPTLLGSASTAPTPAQRSAPVLEKALAAGACVLGRTTMSELGMLSSGIASAHPITRNPGTWTGARAAPPAEPGPPQLPGTRRSISPPTSAAPFGFPPPGAQWPDSSPATAGSRWIRPIRDAPSDPWAARWPTWPGR